MVKSDGETKLYGEPIVARHLFHIFSNLIKLLIFNIMQARADIEFEKLVKIVKQLPAAQWTKLKKEVEEKVSDNEQNFDLVSLLLSAPTYCKTQ